MKKMNLWKCISAAVLFAIGLASFNASAYAADDTSTITGLVYEFEKNSDYEISETEDAESSEDAYTYGEFFISGGDSAGVDDQDIPVYEVADGELSLYYNYSDQITDASESSWHVAGDSGRTVDLLTLDSKIENGVIIVEISDDQTNWTTAACLTDAFAEVPDRSDAVYTAEETELQTGCYYRVTVAYKMRKSSGSRLSTITSKIPVVKKTSYDYKKCAEVYEFYACESLDESTSVEVQSYSLGSKVRTKHLDGYEGEKEIDSDDIHYGWDIGNFFVDGFTDTTTDSDGNVVFLKNVGDEVTLWFNLEQNIDAIQGNAKLTVTADEEGYDQYFETETMEFGRGALIISCTDYNNVTDNPVIYTNFLEANASVGSNTQVELFEEGDYEVALDYEVTRDGLIDKVGHYRIYFTFSVRNSNCMVYLFDVETGDELTNSSYTENGFRLDLANSRYLEITLKREELESTDEGLVEDTRFNGAAKDGAEYTDEGVYTITVSNKYTGQTTSKTIYVGTDEVLQAYATTGLSVSEIDEMVDDGAVIEEDGTITDSDGEVYGAVTEMNDSSDTDESGGEEASEISENVSLEQIGIIVIILLIIVIILVAVLIRRRRR